MTTREQARQQIAELVEKFRNTPASEREAYNEQQSRLYFILPLFRALGWNIENPREVSAEEQISRGYVDFGFYLNGVPVFYLETKRISENLNNPEWGRQAINYAWLRDVTWAVLSDFKGLRVFNAEWKADNPDSARFLDLTWEQYADADFDDLWLLSRESIQKGEINRKAERYGRKTRKEPVNKLLFAQLTQWRRELFKEIQGWSNLFARDTQKLDEAVQRFLDRLIFIRTVEDRGVEPHRLRPLLRQYKDSRRKDRNLFNDLLALFREMDATYNARLFARHPLDEYIEMHNDLLLERIIEGLYDAPRGYDRYDFNAISADILGSIYEQYLGFKTIDPEGKEAVDPGKRGKRKSQGIYYTPQFVVRYIVQQTLGKLLESGADPYKIRVLDPACGSGSFLIEAFDVLDRWIAEHGTEQDKQHPRQRRMRILQENIYGVDLDPQAVEVARLNLLLRAANERGLLPMLEHIKNGNSLIDDPAVAGDMAFKWEEAFPDVMQSGGFDVVIGNPPYVRSESQSAAFKTYAQEKFETYSGSADLYVYFVEKSHQLLKPNGYFGMITSNKFMQTKYGKHLRKMLSTNTQIQSIIDFGELPVFEDAATFPVIITTANRKVERQKTVFAPIKSLDFLSLDNAVADASFIISERGLNGEDWVLVEEHELNLLDKISKDKKPLKEYSSKKIYYGIKTGYNEAFVISRETRHHIVSREAASEQFIKPYVVGDDVRKYIINSNDQYLIVIPSGWTNTQFDGETTDAWSWFSSQYPILAKYLLPFKERASQRGDKGDYWWELRPCDYYDQIESSKIIYPDIAKESRFAYDTNGLYLANTIYFIPGNDLYLLGLLNSNVLFYYYKYNSAVIGDANRGGRLRFFTQYVEQLPIRTINFDDPADVEKHDQMVALVEKMLALKQQHAAAEAALEDRRHDLARQIERLDREIDQRVYQLYALTPDEIAIVEGAATD